MNLKLDRLPRIDFVAIRRIARHFGKHLKPHRGRLISSGAAKIGATIIALALPIPLKIVFDYLLLPTQQATGSGLLSFLTSWDPTSILALAAGSFLVLVTARGMLDYTSNVLSKIVATEFVAEIRLHLFSHVQRLPQAYHDYRETGDLMTRLTGDISLLQDLLITSFVTLASELFLIVGMMALMFWLDWQLALIILALMPLFLLAALRFSGRVKTMARKQREVYGKVVASVQESLAGISHVKTYALENKRERFVARSVDRDVRANVKTARLTENYTRIVELITAVGTCLVLWFGVKKVMGGSITAGDLLVFLTYLRSIYRPLRHVATLSGQISKATVRGEKIMELLEMTPEDLDSQVGISAQRIKGEISFRDVSFHYRAGQPVLKNVNCRIPANKTTVILGHTGAGKSTIAKLILRLYEPTTGYLRLDDKDIREYRVRSLRKRITPLAQDTFLFRMTIGENIGFANSKATQDEIEQAARTAGLEELILGLPQGYDTLVGEGGLTLSGGQRQRLSFARAILRQSPIMIFDEPATGLDVHSEAKAKEVLKELRPDRTIIIITHRLHYLDLADWVIYLRDGSVAEEGEFADLMNRRGDFASFVGQDRSEVNAEEVSESKKGTEAKS